MIQNDKIQSRRTFLYNLGITGGSIVFLPNRYLFFKKERKNTHNFSVCKENKGDNLQNQLSKGWELVPSIVDRIKPPVFPAQDFDVTRYGAIGDSVTDCRKAFLNTIDACHRAGGGRVVVPAGNYLLNGPLYLKSNVNLFLNSGSYIKFGTNPDDYLVGSPEFKGCVLVRWEGLWCYNYSPLIYAWKEENVAITGAGIIDGQMDKYWFEWYTKNLHQPDRKLLRKMGKDLVPVKKRIFGQGHHLAAGTIEFYHCRNVLIEGITTRMPLERTIHPVFCNNVTVRNVNIKSGVKKAQNDDGIDPDSCVDVLIERCTIHNYDDGIALKSGRAKEGWLEYGGRATENVIIRHNVLHGEHNGVSVGSDMSGGVRNIFVYDCQFGVGNKQQYVFNAKSNCDRGGVIENIYFKNIQVGNCRQLIRMEMEYKDIRYHPNEHPYPPLYRNIYFENITCEQAEEYGINIAGLEQSPIQNVHLKDVTIKKANPVMNLVNVTDIECDRVIINGKRQDSKF